MRLTWIKLHLVVASFFSLALLIMAVSGGGYLLGFKGETTKTPIEPANISLDFTSESLEADVRSALAELGIDHDFDYVRSGSNYAITRPTSRTWYEFRQSGTGIEVNRHDPDFQSVLVELHKGHGPESFKLYQQIMAAALLFILLTGLWLGISSKGLRKQTAISAGLGILVFLGLALFG